ncbi:MAG TPA: YciI family protein [Trebonia sp.]|nr:YciI family protein [Trebonia sp.]
MKYLVIMQIDQSVIDSFTPEDWKVIGAGHQSLLDDTRASGELVSSEALADPSQSAVLRKGPAAPVIKDGPFAEAREFMGGFYIFDVESRDRALELAARIPDLAFDGLAVEVRPILALGGGED